ncbi:hypothetical protein PV08_09738 [Exophiala spinifera]|uniref:Uncharacterized protein n=1 Tax=Exophiala spinifera TaxID=91928 RepID=A0A0D1YC11_9EURO|nr:uncharacterized protein PV08_09738 [Exophiala spinifera]KIW12461.1 hypothetical protein PV08_09738 [Exophiala spinifera]
MGFGSPKYTPQPLHHIFSAVLVFLHGIRHARSVIADLYAVEEIEDIMETFSQASAVTVERRLAATRCLEEYKRLLEPVKQDYLTYTTSRQSLGDNIHGNANSTLGDLNAPEDSGRYMTAFFESVVHMPNEHFHIFDETMPLDWDSGFNLETPAAYE